MILGKPTHPYKKVFTVVLALCCTVSTLFYYACLDVAEIVVKIKSGIATQNHDQLLTIQLPASKFNKDRHEIKYRGHLYDVATYHIAGDSVMVSVFHDEEEEDLLAAITEHFEGKTARINNAGLPGMKRAAKPVITDDKWLPPFCRFLQLRNGFATCAYGSIDEYYLSAKYSAIALPPPKAYRYL